MVAIAELQATPQQARIEKSKRAIKRSFNSFITAFPPEKPFLRGRHTNAIIRICDKALKKVEGGESQYIIINVPFRHGKSGATSCRLPVWGLMRNPSWEFIVATYNYSLATEMSIKARDCLHMASPYYGLRIRQDRNQIGSWRLRQGGGVFATGIGGTITGRGGDVVIIDDYYKGIEEAESVVVRDRVRHNFESNLMTRLKPVHLVLVIANRWGVDDLVGWILRKNNPKSDIYDEKFPRFTRITFPMWDEEKGWLFPECYSNRWYEAVKALIGSYAWHAQAQQEPQPRVGNLLKINKIKVYSPKEWAELTKGMPFRRGWDPASSEEERTSENPAYSAGTKACYVDDTLYVDDVVRGQWEAPERDKAIFKAAERDGPNVPLYVEVVAAYKDMYVYLRRLLASLGVVVRRFNPSGKGDKVARASPLEAAFEAGRVAIKKAPWNEDWLREVAAFPSSEKKDQVDSLVIAIYQQLHRRQGVML